MSGDVLARKISLPLLTFYGLGTILGAGIYVLIGEVAHRAGPLTSISFLVAAILAGITAYSFARLSSKIPKSAGPAAYAYEVFKLKSISVIVGLAIIVIGTVSAATMVKGFSGYFNALVELPNFIVIIGIVLLITLLSVWGISQSLIVTAIITILEIVGLLFVIFATVDLNNLNKITILPLSIDLSSSSSIFFAAFITFYAYIGFEDIVNIAEETINPTKVVPLAIYLSLILSTILYLALSISTISFIPLYIFETSTAPLASIVEYKGYNPLVMAVISMIAIINGALIQLIMASRVLYGMAAQNIFLTIFKNVNKKTQTPIYATLTIAFVLILLANFIDLVSLAEVTSAVTLVVFIVVQFTLVVLSIREHSSNKLDFILPPIGIILSLVLIYFGYSQ